jgi:outer membrane protein OmpA-like peptidoglycan-associated protein
MKASNQGNITLVGCNSDNGNEKGKLELSQKRAETIKDYLTSIWHINPERINIKENNLPEKPSSSNDSDGVAENRRVEIISDAPEILSPIVTNDVYFKLVPNAIRVKIKSNTEDSLMDWKLVLMLDSDTLTSTAGNESLPSKIDFDLNDFNKLLSVNQAELTYFLNIKKDSTDRIIKPDSKIFVKRILTKTQKKIERYRLILFDFNKYDLNESNKRIIDFINKKINSKSKVIIEGYTDRVGSEDYNLQLSEARAKAVSDAIHCEDKTFRGLGETSLYNNSLPEGRFFCRTVEIRIEEK